MDHEEYEEYMKVRKMSKAEREKYWNSYSSGKDDKKDFIHQQVKEALKTSCMAVIGFSIVTTFATAVNKHETGWVPQEYNGGQAEIIVEDGFNIVHTSKDDSEHYVFWESGTKSAYEVAARLQTMMSEGTAPQIFDLAWFYSENTAKIISDHCDMKINLKGHMAYRYDSDYSTYLFHANAHEEKILSDYAYVKRFDDVDLLLGDDGIAVDNGTNVIVCADLHEMYLLGQALTWPGNHGAGPRLKDGDMTIMAKEGTKHGMIDALADLGADVKYFEGNYSVTLDESGYHIIDPAMDLMTEITMEDYEWE